MVVGQVLLEILAVPAAFDEVSWPLRKMAWKRSAVSDVAHAPGPLLARPQGRQIIARHERRDAVQGLIVGVELVVFEHAVGRAAGGGGVAGDQILDRPLHVRPVLLEERIVRVVQGLAVGLEHAACVAVDERVLAAWDAAARERRCGCSRRRRAAAGA